MEQYLEYKYKQAVIDGLKLKELLEDSKKANIMDEIRDKYGWPDAPLKDDAMEAEIDRKFAKAMISRNVDVRKINEEISRIEKIPEGQLLRDKIAEYRQEHSQDVNGVQQDLNLSDEEIALILIQKQHEENIKIHGKTKQNRVTTELSWENGVDFDLAQKISGKFEPKLLGMLPEEFFYEFVEIVCKSKEVNKLKKGKVLDKVHSHVESFFGGTTGVGLVTTLISIVVALGATATNNTEVVDVASNIYGIGAGITAAGGLGLMGNKILNLIAKKLNNTKLSPLIDYLREHANGKDENSDEFVM